LTFYKTKKEYQKSRPFRREKEINKEILKPPIKTIKRIKTKRPLKPLKPKEKKTIKTKILNKINSKRSNKKI